jgi:hypothetical protein
MKQSIEFRRKIFDKNYLFSKMAEHSACETKVDTCTNDELQPARRMSSGWREGWVAAGKKGMIKFRASRWRWCGMKRPEQSHVVDKKALNNNSSANSWPAAAPGTGVGECGSEMEYGENLAEREKCQGTNGGSCLYVS